MIGRLKAWTMPATSAKPAPATSHTTRLAVVPSVSNDAPAATDMAAAPHNRYPTAVRAH